MCAFVESISTELFPEAVATDKPHSAPESPAGTRLCRPRDSSLYGPAMAAELRSYIYVSDAKVNALVPQASRWARRGLTTHNKKTSASVKLGMGPAEVTASSDRDSEVAPDRLQRLEVAE